ncbi:ubiquinol-cytochrome c reductase iron-sulfur subunit [Nocardia lijiangensis]|uniref:QcrA and Rieske domain-containing protein n=1 Tax=Nocardia lijiangensis TaxID=299618 RepID=UPI003D756B13
MTSEDRAELRIDRRTALASAGVAAAAVTVAACATAEPSSREVAPGTEVAKVADVPVGGAVIAGGTVVTQPQAGVYQGFSAACTHLGCSVSKIERETIVCRCHGSAFRFDGTVATGPAERPLAPRAVRVDGDRIVTA